MSYILEALRKAERERNLGQAPTLEDVTHAPPAPALQQRPWKLIGMSLLVAVLGIALAISLLRKPAAVATAAPVVQVQPEETAAVAPPPVAVPVAAAVEAPPVAETPAVEDLQGASTLDELYDAGAEIIELPAPVIAAPSRPAATAPPVEQAAAAVEPEMETLPQDDAPIEEVAPAPSAAQTQVEQLRLDPAPQKTLKQMPESYRADFPQISIDVHVSNADPARRFVLINGRRYREGEALAEGPRIVGIVEEGIVFDYRGEKVLYVLPR